MAVVANLDAILGTRTEAFVRGIDGAITTTEELQASLKEAGLSQRDWNRIVREAESVTKSVVTPMERYEQEVRDLERLLKAGLITQQTYNRAIDRSQASLRNANQETSTFSTGLRRVGASILSAAAAWVSFQGALRVVDGIRQVTLELDELAQASDRLNILPENLQAIRFASSQTSRVAADQVDTVASDLTIRISEAVRNGGEVARIFEEIGVSVQELNQRTSDQQFLEFSDAIRNIGNVNDQIRVVDELLSDTGVELINTFRLGSDEIRRQTDFLRDNNLELSRADLAQVEKFNDAWARAGTLIDGIVNRLVVDLAPALQGAVEGTDNVVSSLNQLSGETGFSDAFIRSFDAAAVNINLLSAGFGQFQVNVGRFTGNQEQVQSGLESIATAFESIDKVLGLVNDEIDRSATVIAPDTSALDELTAKAAEFKKLIETPSQVFIRQVSTLNELLDKSLINQFEFNQLLGQFEAERDSELTELIQKQTEEADRIAETLRRDNEREAQQAADQLARAGETLTDSVRTPLEAATDEIQRFQDLLNQGAISRETFDRAADREIEALEGLIESQRASQVNINDAISQGSNEAFNVIFGRQTTDPNTELLNRNNQLTAEMLAEFKLLIEAARRTAEASETLVESEDNEEVPTEMVLNC